MTNRILSGAMCLLLAPVTALAGCTSAPPAAASRSSTPAPPRVATYDCGEGGQIRIEHLGGMVRIHEPVAVEADSGELAAASPIELAAAPPGQQSRYGSNGYALVVEGREALWMKAGKTPLTCMR
jgi:hypothetical protein